VKGRGPLDAGEVSVGPAGQFHAPAGEEEFGVGRGDGPAKTARGQARQWAQAAQVALEHLAPGLGGQALEGAWVLHWSKVRQEHTAQETWLLAGPGPVHHRPLGGAAVQGFEREGPGAAVYPAAQVHGGPLGAGGLAQAVAGRFEGGQGAVAAGGIGFGQGSGPGV